MQKDIEQKEKLEQMRNDFLGNVSHELKTPLALIQGYAEGLKDGVTSDPESMDFYCDVIIDEASKMNNMVRNLLTLNQLEFGDEDITFERFDLTAVIRGVIQSMDIMAQQGNATVNFRRDEPVYVWADEFKVEQVIRNYMSNAFHHLNGEKIVEVKVYMEDAEKADSDSYSVTWKSVTANRVDTKKLQTVYPEVYKECAKPSQSRRFTVKEIA